MTPRLIWKRRALHSLFAVLFVGTIVAVLLALVAPAAAAPDRDGSLSVEKGDRVQLEPRADRVTPPVHAGKHPYLLQLSRDFETALEADDPLAGERLATVSLVGTRSAGLRPMVARATAWALGDVLRATFQEAGVGLSAARLARVDAPRTVADVERAKLLIDDLRRDLRQRARRADDAVTPERRRLLERALSETRTLLNVTERVYRGDALRPASAHASAVTAVLMSCRAAGLSAADTLALATDGLAEAAGAAGS